MKKAADRKNKMHPLRVLILTPFTEIKPASEKIGDT